MRIYLLLLLGFPKGSCGTLLGRLVALLLSVTVGDIEKRYCHAFRFAEGWQ
ncbi:hypothetical protein H5T88_01700 [bacterium]|nr:hypothetical protein [bacterium]